MTDCLASVTDSAVAHTTMRCAAICAFHKTSPAYFYFDKDKLNCSVGDATALVCDDWSGGTSFSLEVEPSPQGINNTTDCFSIVVLAFVILLLLCQLLLSHHQAIASMRSSVVAHRAKIC